MDILTPPLQVYQDRRLSEFTAPRVDVIGATIGQTFNDLFPIKNETVTDLYEAEHGQPTRAGTYMFKPGTATPLLSKPDAEEQLKAKGLAGQLEIPDTGIRQGALDILVQNRIEQNKRASVLARGDDSFALGVGKLAASLVTSALDPINDVAGFLPVVGEARYAKLLASAGESVLGRAAVRAGVGAVEGTAGMAALTPLQAAGASAMQDPYNTNDALANILYGAAFGAMLHTVGPGIRDTYRFARGMPLSERTAVATEAIASVLDDRPARVGELMDAFSTARRAELMRGTSLGTRTVEFRPPEEAAPAMRFEPSPTNNAPAFTGRFETPQTRPNGEPATYPADLTGFKSEITRLQKAAAKEGRTLELRQEPDGTHTLVETSQVSWLDQYPDQAAATAARNRLAPAERADVQVVPFQTQARGSGFALVRGLTEKQAADIRANPALAERIVGDTAAPEAPTAAVEAQPQAAVAPGQQLDQITRQSVADRFNRLLTTIRDDRVNLSPRDLAARAEVKALAKSYATPQTDGGLSELEAYAADTEDALNIARQAERLSEEETAHLKEADRMVADTGKVSAGLKAAAACIGRAL